MWYTTGARLLVTIVGLAGAACGVAANPPDTSDAESTTGVSDTGTSGTEGGLGDASVDQESNGRSEAGDPSTDAMADCGSPGPDHNDPRCPSPNKSAVGCGACPSEGLTCGYRGLGDRTPNGCFGARVLFCTSASSACQSDGGGLHWQVTQ